jgi:hypothetical protein
MKKTDLIHNCAQSLEQNQVIMEALPILTVGYTFELVNGKPDLRKGKLVLSVTNGITPELVTTALQKAIRVANKKVIEKAKSGQKLNGSNHKNIN